MRRDEPDMRVEERVGECRVHAIVRIVRRNGERLIDERQHEHRLRRLDLVVVDADLGLIGLHVAVVRVIVNLQHDARICGKQEADVVRQLVGPRTGRPSAERR